MMFLAGGLITEHNRFVDNRDTLKAASDAAVVAATQHLHRLPTSMSDSDVEALLEDTARRYAFLVVEGNSPDPVTPDDIDITLRLNRAAGVVGVDVATNMRGLLFKQLVSAQGEKKMAVRSGAEQEVSPAVLVLALDSSGSMRADLAGFIHGPSRTDVVSRADIVRDAAHALADELMVSDHMSIGIVPWAATVCRSRCASGLEITAPSNLPNRVRQALDHWQPRGRYTYSPLAVREGMRLLDNAPAHVARGLVLLTDGEDNICKPNGNPNDDSCTPHRRAQLRDAACTAAKEADITIWVVAAMSADQVDNRFARELRECASEGEQHVFVSNVDADDLEGAFESISTQVKALRRTY